MSGADVVYALDADDIDGARRTLTDAAADVRARPREMAARNEGTWSGPATVVEVRSAGAVLADPVCRDAAEYVASMGRMVGYRLRLHGSATQAWTLAEFGGSALLRDYAQASPAVEYVEHPSWDQDGEQAAVW